MTVLSARPRRSAAMALETAVVLPVLMLLVFAIIEGGMGIFRYQLVACQAREAARYASVHGADWQSDTNNLPVTQNDIIQKVVLPLAVGMDTSQLSVRVQWVDRSSGVVYDWDGSLQYVKSLTAQGEYVTNNVRITTVYNWVPTFFSNSIQLQSTSEMPMSN